jgi:hypothetical protein
MSINNFNIAEWCKNIFKELENIRYCYFLAFLFVYVLILFIPESLAEKIELFRYINFLSLFAIFAMVMLLGKIINSFSLKLELYFKNKNILKYLKTLNPDEMRALSLGAICEQQTIYMNFQDSAGESLLYKGLVIKCDGKQDYEGAWPYIIPDFVWNKIKKDPIFKKLSKDEIINCKNQS